MSILDAYDEEKEILSPAEMVRPVEGMPSVALVTFKEQILRLARRIEGACPLCTLSAGFELPVLRVPFGGSFFAVYQTLIGAASSAALMEEMAARGVRKFVFFGSCGALAPLPGGHVIVPTAAYRDEGVSYHYAPPGDYIEVPTAGRLAGILESLGVPFIAGKVWTTDAFYRETRRKADARRREGCVAVEMECAALTAVARFRGFEVYQFLYTEDSLAGESWDRGLMGRVPESAHESYLNLALSVAARL